MIGPNGAGKTTLFNLVSGLLRPTSGRVLLDGDDITAEPPFRRAGAGIGRTFQVSNVFPLLSALENVRLAAEAALGGTMRIWRRATHVRQAVERAHWALERVGLDGARARVRPASLSHGDKRKLELAMVLAGDARVILLDEPMAGVSMEDVPELVELIRSVHAEGKTVLMVEHHMEVVTGLAQRIAVLHHGALLAVDEPQAIMQNETVQQAYLGEPI